jgi:Family of unknown function (DUF6496)
MGYPGPRRTSAFHRHMRSRMRSFTKGKMHSTKARTGPVVRSTAQAVAIALSEARAKHLRGAPPAPKR